MTYYRSVTVLLYIYIANIECSGDSDCPSDYLCGSNLPGPGQNQFENPGANIPGGVMFLQRDSLQLDGYSLVSLPVSSLPPLMTDLTIFATVCQERGNDGYVLGKGVNDRLRDFGLYLRSSMRTVWLAYGASDTTEGFQHILFFYDISVADGNCHSVAAVIDSASDKAVLYIDGKAEGIVSPLPGVPDFRPNVRIISMIKFHLRCTKLKICKIIVDEDCNVLLNALFFVF